MRRIHLLSNSRSGKGHGETLPDLAKKICQELGAELIVYDTSAEGELDVQTDIAIKSAQRNSDDVIVAAGGDGTVRAIAEKASAANVRVAIVPCGTFNFFARTHQIPEDFEQALRLAITGPIQKVRLGEINGKTFVINASLGVYADSAQERKELTHRFGRQRLVIMLATVRTLLRPHRLLHVHLTSDGVHKEVRTPMIFIGNNSLQLRKLSLSVAKCFQENLLAVVALKPVRGWEMVRVIFRGFARTLENEERLSQFCTRTLRIETRRPLQTVSLDGERFEMHSPFMIKSLPEALQMVVPPPAAETQAFQKEKGERKSLVD